MHSSRKEDKKIKTTGKTQLNTTQRTQTTTKNTKKLTPLTTLGEEKR